MPAIRELLDESRLEGVEAIERGLGPAIQALVVAAEDLADAGAAIESCCQLWGGGLYSLLPLAAGAVQFDDPWLSLLAHLETSWLGTRDHLPAEMTRMGRFFTHSGIWGDSLLKLLLAIGERPENLRSVRVSDVDPDDPWYVAYLGTLGRWPERPSVVEYGFVGDVTFEAFIKTHYEKVDKPGPQDLLSRLRDASELSPATATILDLTSLGAPRNMSLIEGTPVLPSDTRAAANIGPNLVVVYEPGSVADLCLLWQLRAAHGLPRGFPLAVPASSDVVAALDAWMADQAATLWQLRAPHPSLVSLSVPRTDLEKIAVQTHPRWTVVEPDEVLQPATMARSVSTTVATFENGKARIALWSDPKINELGRLPSPFSWQQLHVRLRPQRLMLPRSTDLEKHTGMFAGPLGGGWDSVAGTPGKTAIMEWPAGWTVLESALQDRGLRAQPSQAGRIAAALLRRLGSLTTLEALLSESLIRELYRLCEREGMTWFRQRLREMGRKLTGDDAAKLARLEREIRDLHIPRADGAKPRPLRFTDLQRRVFHIKPATEAWLKWAEEAGLLMRGVTVYCNGCGASSWRTMGEMAPPVVCRGCGTTVHSPYPADRLEFQYQASEALVQATAVDSLPHLLAMRYFCRLFAAHTDGVSPLYGAYPGVDFSDEAGNQLGEADLVLLSTSGEIALGECKRSGVGLKEPDIAHLDRLCSATAAEWSFLAVPVWASECSELWRSSARELPEPPRFVLTAEHLLDPDPRWEEDALSWRSADDQQKAERESAFADRTGRLIEWMRGPGGWEAWHAAK